MSFDLEKIRAETPGVQHVPHLIASGAGLMPQPVIDAIKDHIDLEARIGGYEAAAQEAERLDGVYDSIADLIGAKPQEIALVENATVAWCQAFYALPFQPGDRILTSEAEYAANYVAFLQRQKRDGIVIDVIPNDETGALDIAALEAMIDDRTALIAITWIPTNGGLVNPAAAVGKIARAHEIPCLLDACQAVGQMPVDVAGLGCDFLSATGRKFLRGPRGTGFLYVREELIETLEPPVIDHFAAPWVSRDIYELRPDARRFENWENAYALRAGLGAAADYATAIGLKAIQKRAWSLANGLRERLRSLPGATVRDLGSEQCAIVSFTLDGHEPRAVVAALRKQGINIGTSDPASTRLDAEARNLPVLLRAAPHYYNTDDELDRLIHALKKL
ncbi:MAG: aminotransferase class V-fold PLP-dependent enzyme [Hyphomicrobiaceae bacterium]